MFNDEHVSLESSFVVRFVLFLQSCFSNEAYTIAFPAGQILLLPPFVYTDIQYECEEDMLYINIYKCHICPTMITSPHLGWLAACSHLQPVANASTIV